MIFHALGKYVPMLFVFCEKIREDKVLWKKRHKDALNGHYINRQGRKKNVDHRSYAILKTGS